ncbi:MAG: rod shape-determining protein MreC [Planctomycetota bacterium]|jgi:rod shape-determining protein MreC
MAKKQVKIPNKILLAWFILAGFIILLAPQSLTNKLQFAFARIFCSPLNIGRNISLSAHTQHSLTEVVSLSKYNKLRNHLANVNQWLHQERQKVEKLSGLRDRPVWKGTNFILADIITFSGSSNNNLIINRGENDGLAKGQFVLSDYGIIGTISDVDYRTSQVSLITEPGSRIPVNIAKLETGAIMKGNGNNSAKLQWLSIKHKIKVGDVVYAQKKPGFLDTPIVAGTVAQCKQDTVNPLLWDITVKPACDVKKLNSVTVIVINPKG